MNRPPKGDEYRRDSYALLMFQPSANNTPDMTINIKQGSFWINNSQFIEYAGGKSPVITAPTSGAKWVLVALNKAGKIVLLNGVPSNNNPSVPNIGQNILPIAFVYIKSSTKVITNDMIYDARPVYAAGGYPLNHNELQNRNKENSHTIEAITDLQSILDDKLSLEEAKALIATKANSTGTDSASFTLNAEDTGTPVEHCGIYVNRGSMPRVGIKYDEDLDKWVYTDDGSNWNSFDNDARTNIATATSLGNVMLSEEPADPNSPVAVSITDPLYLSINEKVSKTELSNKYVTNESLQNKLDLKLDVESAYSKDDINAIFVTKSELDNRILDTYTRSQIDSFLSVKANASQTYTKDEVNTLLNDYYTKTDVDDKFNQVDWDAISNLHFDDYYKKVEVDTLLQNVVTNTYTRNYIDSELSKKADYTQIHAELDLKADKSDTYTKSEVDNKFDNALTNSKDLFYQKQQVNDLLDQRALVNHNHSSAEIIEDSVHKFVSESQINAWNAKQDALGYTPENSANRGIANGYVPLDNNGKIPEQFLPDSVLEDKEITTIATYDDLLAIPFMNLKDGQEYFVQDASGDSRVRSGSATYVYNNNGFQLESSTNHTTTLDWDDITNKPDLNDYIQKDLVYLKTETYNQTEINNLLANKADSVDIYTKSDVYNKTETNNLLASKADTVDVYDKSTVDSLIENAGHKLQEFTDPTGNCKYYAYKENALVFSKTAGTVRIVKNDFVHSLTFHFDAADIDSNSRVKIDYDDTNLPADFLSYNLADVSFIQVMGSQGATKVSNNVFYTDMSNPHYCELAAPFGNQGPIVVKIVY